MSTEIKDTLKRGQEASILLKVLLSEQQRRFASGESLVVSLAAPWGYGKTTFLRLLENEAKESHFVFYFDAWANDHSNDALTSFLAEFHGALTSFAEGHKSGLATGAGNARRSVLKGTKAVLKAAAPLVLGHIMKRAAGITANDILSAYNEQEVESSSSSDSTPDSEDDDSEANVDKEAVVNISSQVVTDIATAALNSHAKAKAARVALSTALQTLNEAIEDIEGFSAPIVILIDELDRCRPNYAIELLETMKHFFNSPEVIYIVANNADELGHSIRALYGAEFDAAGYLRRFFDFQYRLKEPDTRLFCEGISSDFDLDRKDRFVTPLESIHKSYKLKDDISDDLAAWHLQLAMQVFGLSLRDVTQIALRTYSISMVASRKLDLFVLLFMVSADHLKSGSHRKMMLKLKSTWDNGEIPIVVNFEFKDRRPDKPEHLRTTISSIFGFYADAELKLSSDPLAAGRGDVTFLNQAVLSAVANRHGHDAPIAQDYSSLVEQLSNLTV